MTRIVAVTPNPAIDVTYDVDAVTVGASHRVRRVTERAGGKAVNVGRVIHAFGGDCTVVAPLGGTTGRWVASTLRRDGVDVVPVDIAGPTRRTVTIVDQRSASVFNEAGPVLAPDECAALVEAATAALDGASVLVVSGSLPPGVPDDLPAQLVRAARAAGVLSVVDAVGPALLAAAENGAEVVKPNAAELQATTGMDDIWSGAAELLRVGARRVVVSLGENGLIGMAGGGAWRVTAPARVVGNPTGAGDAAVAALAMGLVDRVEWPESLRRAAALGAAAAATPVAGDVDLDAYARFLPDCVAEVLDADDVTS